MSNYYWTQIKKYKMKVTHRYYTIRPSMDMVNAVEELALIAINSKAIGMNDELYNWAKGQYDIIRRQYEENANKAKSKSHTDWLGGGVTYNSYSLPEWESRCSSNESRICFYLKNYKPQPPQIPQLHARFRPIDMSGAPFLQIRQALEKILRDSLGYNEYQLMTLDCSNERRDQYISEIMIRYEQKERAENNDEPTNNTSSSGCMVNILLIASITSSFCGLLFFLIKCAFL